MDDHVSDVDVAAAGAPWPGGFVEDGVACEGFFELHDSAGGLSVLAGEGFGYQGGGYDGDDAGLDLVAVFFAVPADAVAAVGIEECCGGVLKLPGAVGLVPAGPLEVAAAEYVAGVADEVGAGGAG